MNHSIHQCKWFLATIFTQVWKATIIVQRFNQLMKKIYQCWIKSLFAPSVQEIWFLQSSTFVIIYMILVSTRIYKENFESNVSSLVLNKIHFSTQEFLINGMCLSHLNISLSSSRIRNTKSKNWHLSSTFSHEERLHTDR